MNIMPSDEYDFRIMPTAILHKLHEAAVRSWRRKLEDIFEQTQAIHALHNELHKRGEL